MRLLVTSLLPRRPRRVEVSSLDPDLTLGGQNAKSGMLTRPVAFGSRARHFYSDLSLRQLVAGWVCQRDIC